jgi:hypothetical protein
MRLLVTFFFFFSETRSLYIAQAGLKLVILLPQPLSPPSARITGMCHYAWLTYILKIKCKTQG